MLSRTERVVCLIILIGAAVVTLYPLVVLASTALAPVNGSSGGISFSHALSFSAFSYAWQAGGSPATCATPRSSPSRWWRSRR